MSFRLRDLLAGAPIGRAAAHQPRTRSERSIETRNCVRRLRDQRTTGKYAVDDLFNDTLPYRYKALNAELDLWVNPSGVRAVRLVEDGEQSDG